MSYINLGWITVLGIALLLNACQNDNKDDADGGGDTDTEDTDSDTTQQDEFAYDYDNFEIDLNNVLLIDNYYDDRAIYQLAAFHYEEDPLLTLMFSEFFVGTDYPTPQVGHEYDLSEFSLDSFDTVPIIVRFAEGVLNGSQFVQNYTALAMSGTLVINELGLGAGETIEYEITDAIFQEVSTTPGELPNSGGFTFMDDGRKIRVGKLTQSGNLVDVD